MASKASVASTQSFHKPVPSPPQPAAKRNPATRRLTVFYVASLSAIAGLSIVGQVLIQNALNQQAIDIEVIRMAEQQKVRVSQMTRTAMLMHLSTDADQRQHYQEEVQEAIAATAVWQQEMAALGANSQVSQARRQQIQRMVQQLAPVHQQILNSVRETMAGTGPSRGASPAVPRPQGLLRAARDNNNPRTPSQPQPIEQTFMRHLDQLILDYNQQVAAGIQYLKRLELSLLGITLLVLLLEGVLVFRPAVQKIRESVTALAQSLQNTQAIAKRLDLEQKKSEKLLLNILPEAVAHRLLEKHQAIADGFAEVSVLFADIVDFTQLSTTMPPQELVQLLNQIFSSFDELAEKHGLEKIKTIGDAYMVVGGLPVPRADHAEAIVAMGLDMQGAIARFNQKTGHSCQIRIGINSGPVVAGVIGIKKFIYDLWGDTVNTASRMESHGVPGGIHITASTYQRIKHKYRAESQGIKQIKGKGEMETYLIVGSPSESSTKAAKVQKV